MEVTCPGCAARYTADEQKLRGKTARMRCRACDTVWLVSGPENIIMNEAKRAAVVKRGAERDHRDLFASRPADLGSVKQTLRPPPPESLYGGVAARNESSVLFTVDALRNAGAARVKTPEPELAPPSTAFIASDDEGVIDLKSLSSAPPRVGARSVAPLFSEPAPAAFASDVGSSSSGYPIAHQNGFTFGKRAIAGLAAAAIFVVLCSIGLAAAFKGEEPVARAANAVMAPIAPPAVVAVVARAAPVAASVAPTTASSSDSDDKAPVTKGKGKATRGKGGKAQSSGVASAKKSSSSSDPLVSKPLPKAADKCGCKGDFTCILRCTAKGS